MKRHAQLWAEIEISYNFSPATAVFVYVEGFRVFSYVFLLFTSLTSFFIPFLLNLDQFVVWSLLQPSQAI